MKQPALNTIACGTAYDSKIRGRSAQGTGR